MQEIVTAIPAISGLIEKGGIIGLLMVLIYFLVREVMRLRKELGIAYGQRDRERYIAVRYKSALDNAGIKVDVSDVLAMFHNNVEHQ